MRGPGVTAAAAAAAFYSFLFRAFSVAPFGKKSEPTQSRCSCGACSQLAPRLDVGHAQEARWHVCSLHIIYAAIAVCLQHHYL